MRILVWFAMGLAAAAALGAYLLPAQTFLWAAAICAVILSCSLVFIRRWKKSRVLALMMTGCVIGFCWQTVFDNCYLSATREADGVCQPMIVYATDYSRETDYGVSVEGYLPLDDGFYRVIAYLPKDTVVSPGDRVEAYFTLRCTLPGYSGESSYSSAKGIFLRVNTEMAEVERCEKTPWYGYSAVTRQYLTDMIEVVFPSDVTDFTRALLLGDTQMLDYETDTGFKVSGIRHIVAVSGLHVSILFSMLFLLTGRRNTLSIILGIPSMIFFAAVMGFSPSVTRACVMHSLMAAAMLFKKEYDPPSALSFAAIVLLLANPLTITHVGFQLSVSCVMGILLFSQRISQWLMDSSRLGKPKGFWKKPARWFASSVSVSIGATLVTTPLCAVYFRMVSLVGVLTNLVTLWAVTFAFYAIVFTCLVGVFSATVASVFGWIAAWPLRFVLIMAKFLASAPLAAVYMHSIYLVLWLFLSYVLLGAYLLMKRKRPLTGICCSAIFLCIALFASWTEPLTDECRVTVLDVGQDQCILLQSEGKTFLIDCGGDSDTESADLAAGTLLSQGIYELDGLILTHYDADHAAGTMNLLSRVPAKQLYLPIAPDNFGHYGAISAAYGDTITMVPEMMTITYGDTVMTLVPSQNLLSDNESGMCILFQTKNCDILITGDREAEGELELMRSLTLPELEVLIVGHHGSKYSSCDQLLAVTRPRYAIISVSADNTYGHPAQEVLDRLESYGCIVYRTDLDGTVIYRG